MQVATAVSVTVAGSTTVPVRWITVPVLCIFPFPVHVPGIAVGVSLEDFCSKVLEYVTTANMVQVLEYYLVFGAGRAIFTNDEACIVVWASKKAVPMFLSKLETCWTDRKSDTTSTS